MKKIKSAFQKSLKYLATAAVLCAVLLYNHIRIEGRYCFELSIKHIHFRWVKIREIHSISQFVDIRVVLKISFFCVVGILLGLAFHQFRVKKWRYYLMAAFAVTVMVDVLYYLTSENFRFGDWIDITVNFNSWINCMIGLCLGNGIYQGALSLYRRIVKHFEAAVLSKYALSEKSSGGRK